MLDSLAFKQQMVRENVLPIPSWLTSVISPPIICANRRLMASPNPVPPYFRVMELSACSKALNNCRWLFSGMPMPVSCTSKQSRISVGVSLSIFMRNVTQPTSVNLIALDVRLSNICPNLNGSPKSAMSLTSGETSKFNIRPFSVAFGLVKFQRSSRTLLILKST